jgi:cytochrome P450
MSSFTFVDGTHVPKNNWVCVPHFQLMNLPDTYSNPEAFQGFRFVNEEGTGSTNRFWDMTRSYQFWGNPKTG